VPAFLKGKVGEKKRQVSLDLRKTQKKTRLQYHNSVHGAGGRKKKGMTSFLAKRGKKKDFSTVEVFHPGGKECACSREKKSTTSDARNRARRRVVSPCGGEEKGRSGLALGRERGKKEEERISCPAWAM